jgi:hypothetical protein
MLDFDTFFENYPATPYKIRSYAKAKEEFDRINPSKQELLEIIASCARENEIRQFAIDNNRDYAQTPDPYLYLSERQYKAKIPTKEEVLSFPRTKKRNKLEKEAIMRSTLAHAEKVMLRFILSLSIRVGNTFWNYNSNSIFFEKGVARVSDEWKDVLRKYSVDVMSNAIHRLSIYKDAPLSKPIELPFIAFVLEEEHKSKQFVKLSPSKKMSPVDESLTLMRSKFPDYDEIIRKQKTAKDKLRAHMQMQRQLGMSQSNEEKCMQIADIIDRKIAS